MVFPYEKQAMNREPIPDGLDWLDQKMYLSLRSLYADVQNGTISRETGILDKKKLAVSYQKERENESFNQKWARHTTQLWKGIESAQNSYRKNRTIENADRLSNAIAGFLTEDFNLSWASGGVENV